MTPKAPELPVIDFEDAGAFERWLAEHHARSPGAWLRIAKKKSPLQSVGYAEAVDIALCWGWIDGQAKSVDEASYVQRFTPRRPRSVWSKINREKVARLIKAGRMQPPGLAAVESAKADGRWEQAYDSPSTATVPDDLRTELDARPDAAAFFETLNAANRYAILWRVQTARTAATRAKRIATLLDKLERGEKIHG